MRHCEWCGRIVAGGLVVCIFCAHVVKNHHAVHVPEAVRVEVVLPPPPPITASGVMVSDTVGVSDVVFSQITYVTH